MHQKITKVDQEKKQSSKSPSYKSDGCAVWVNQDKENKPYLAINITGHNTIYAFLNKNK